MLAKAAASASTPMVKGSVYLDWFDAKYIHFMATIWELEQLIHVCKLLLKTIAPVSYTHLDVYKRQH